MNKDSSKSFTISLNINNIGPHYGEHKIDFSETVDSNKAIFFATNGTGKSFISRIFRLLEPEKTNCLADDLLTLGQTSGTMNFSITSPLISKLVSVKLERGQSPSIYNQSDLIFHTFNSDFVEENIVPNKYTPNGNIDGYILGKSQIDLSKEKEKENLLKAEIESKNNEISEIIEKAKSVLKENGVTSSTTEFKMFNIASFRKPPDDFENLDFDEIVGQLKKIENVPENILSAKNIIFSVNTSLIEEIADMLSTSYPKSEWDIEFTNYYNKNRGFIETGIELYNSNNSICPFCKQSFSEQALDIIQKYKQYQADKEAEILKKLSNFSFKIDGLISNFVNVSNDIANATNAINDIKKYFPSLEKATLDTIDVSETATNCFLHLKNLIVQKEKDIGVVFSANELNIGSCKSYINSVENVISKNNRVIDNVNKTKNNTNAERLSLRKKLCNSKFKLVLDELTPLFVELDSKQKELVNIQKEISEKESSVKVSKREKVYETLICFLNLFFDGKYTLDKETFQIVFSGNLIGANASRVLSDGEKSIVAFCYYLATTHLLITREDDYNKLFFVIDDPISSMDFHYVYVVSQALRDIKKIFNITQNERMWVFTHNTEFFSIITRNHIINKAYMLKAGNISEIKQNLLLPYESHLRDVVKVSKGELSPSHTTANSIRHILETVCRFEFPEKGIEKYISENEKLRENSCIFTICQDLSHGNINRQSSFSEDVLKLACKTIVEFMKQEYPGQIDAIK